MRKHDRWDIAKVLHEVRLVSSKKAPKATDFTRMDVPGSGREANYQSSISSNPSADHEDGGEWVIGLHHVVGC
jgi:hypothetical protein